MLSPTGLGNRTYVIVAQIAKAVISELAPARFTWPRSFHAVAPEGDDCQNHTSVPPMTQLCPPPITFLPAGQVALKSNVPVWLWVTLTI